MEREAYRQDEIQQGNGMTGHMPYMQQLIYVVRKKIIVFEECEETQIDNNADDQK